MTAPPSVEKKKEKERKARPRPKSYGNPRSCRLFTNNVVLDLPHLCLPQKNQNRLRVHTVRQQLPDRGVAGPSPCLPNMKAETLPTLEGPARPFPGFSFSRYLPNCVPKLPDLSLPRLALLEQVLSAVFPARTTNTCRCLSTPISP